MLFCAVRAATSSAQSPDQKTTVADTTTAQHVRPTEKDTAIVVQKSPRGAMLRSLFVPGWGQLYNGKWLKAIVIAGAEIGLITNAVIQNQLAVRSTNIYEKEFYQNNRGLSIWWLAGIILYSMADAYVDAHLYNFDESPDLSFYIWPGTDNITFNQEKVFTVAVKYHF